MTILLALFSCSCFSISSALRDVFISKIGVVAVVDPAKTAEKDFLVSPGFDDSVVRGGKTAASFFSIMASILLPKVVVDKFFYVGSSSDVAVDCSCTLF